MAGNVKSGASIATGPGVLTRTGSSSSDLATGSDTVAVAGTGSDAGVAAGTDSDSVVMAGAGSDAVVVAGVDSDAVVVAGAGSNAVVVGGAGVGLEGGCSATTVGSAPTWRPEDPDESGESLPHATASKSIPATSEIASKPFLFRPNTAPIKPPLFTRCRHERVQIGSTTSGSLRPSSSRITKSYSSGFLRQP